MCSNANNKVRKSIRQHLANIKEFDLKPSHIVTAVQLPTGAVEIAINTEKIPEKLQYMLEAYDENMRLRTNPNVRMLDIMVVIT